MEINQFVKLAVQEDVKQGDHSTLSCIPKSSIGSAKLLVKENGIISGINLAKEIFNCYDSTIDFKSILKDGQKVSIGDIAFIVSGKSSSILTIERLVLNVMQRMSAISTLTNKYVEKLEGLNCKILDTRKTTPLNRFLEKEAVKIGGGYNHRFGLYDMVMLKDNHIDFAGGIQQAIEKTNNYLNEKKLNIKIIPGSEPIYCLNCKTIKNTQCLSKKCSRKHKIKISGSKIRELLKKNKRIPDYLMDTKISKLLSKKSLINS